jgi:hypothetical protein
VEDVVGVVVLAKGMCLLWVMRLDGGKDSVGSDRVVVDVDGEREVDVVQLVEEEGVDEMRWKASGVVMEKLEFEEEEVDEEQFEVLNGSCGGGGDGGGDGFIDGVSADDIEDESWDGEHGGGRGAEDAESAEAKG